MPVNIAHGHEATVSPFSVAVKRQAIASTVYSSTVTEIQCTGLPGQNFHDKSKKFPRKIRNHEKF